MRELPTGTVTLLFTDIEGSTKLLQRAGERYPDLLAEQRRLLRGAFVGHGGHEVDSEGDAFFVVFDSARQAVAAAAEAQRALAAHAWPKDAEIRVRIGIHTGWPRLIERKYVGIDVHRAARVMAAGHGGQVLLSQTTRKELEDHAPLLDLGEHRLKDLLQAEHLYQLLIDGLPREFPALKTLGNRPTNLPVQPNLLIGRERELGEVGELLRESDGRLLTLTGAGGMGKTRLALQLGAELLDESTSGVFFVSLAPIRDPNLLIPAIAQTLAVREVPGEDLLATVSSYLEDKEMVLLLDNFEQIVEAASLLATLLSCCPKLKLLVTSRERLRLAAEQVYEVPPLALPDGAVDLAVLAQNEAVALFVARAQAVKPGFILSRENAAVVAEVCSRLDGLPLAIELAAARILLLPPEALLKRLDQRFELLTVGAREAEERQQTLRKTIEWSYELLSESEQILFARLSVFVGGCRIDAAEAVCSPHGDLRTEVVDGLQSLVEKSLLRQKQDPDGEPRFWMLETISEYALERLSPAESDQVGERHAAYFLDLAEAGEHEMKGPRAAPWMERFDEEHADLRAASAWLLGHDKIEGGLRLCGALHAYWLHRGHFVEALHTAEDVLAGSTDPSDMLRAKVLGVVGEFARLRGDYERAKAALSERLALHEQAHDRAGVAATLTLLGHIAAEEGQYAEASALYERSLALVEKGHAEPWHTLALALNNLAWAVLHEGHLERARALLERGLAEAEILDSTILIGMLKGNLARIALEEGDLEESRALLRASLRLAWVIREMQLVWEDLDVLARVEAAAGNSSRSARLAGAADAVREEIGLVLPEDERARRDRLFASARAQVEEERWSFEHSAGNAMPLDRAVAYALEEEPTPAASPHAGHPAD